MIKKAYILGVQDALVAAEVVKYANEEMAAQDAGMLSDAMDQHPIDEAAMATDEVSPDATAQIATAVVQMAQEAGATAEEAKAKADIAAQAASELAKSGSLKMADQVSELATAIPNTANQVINSDNAGAQADANKGEIGKEENEPVAAVGDAKASDQKKELATAIPNTASQVINSDNPGAQADAGKGQIGVETKHSSLLERIARL